MALDEKTEEEILEFIAYAENFSNHRIAKSIVQEYNDRYKKEINFAWINGASEIAGLGIQANIFGIDCLVGNAKLLHKNNIEFKEAKSPYTIIYLTQNEKLAGYIEIKDQVKANAKQTIDNLKKLGITNISMFTGDKEATAKAVSNELGLDCYHSELLPKNKVEELKKHKDYGKLIFVGDGINDAPILSTVDVGISMGGVGSDIAIESSDIVIVDDNISKIPLAISISRKTKRIVLENIIFAIGIKALVLILATLGIANMWLAIFADVGVSILAILNAIRALFVPRKYKQKLDKHK